MTQTPAGWYPDPDPAVAGQPGRLRYWDGTAWTEHVNTTSAAPPAPPAPPAYPSAPPAYPSAPPAYPSAPPTYPGAPGYGYGPAYSGADGKTTPDGARLSGWWLRVLAALLDGLFQFVLILAASIPVIASQADELSDWFNALQDSIENNTPQPPDPALLDPSTGPGLALVLIGLGVVAAYSVLFLGYKQATPGKLIVGLRVRLRENPSLPWATVFTRVGFVTALSVLLQIAGPIAFVFLLLTLLDYLWPLWDGNKQALHDKVAKTNVVRKD